MTSNIESPSIRTIPLSPRNPSLTREEQNDLRQQFETLLRKGNEHPEDLDKNLYDLRKLILLHGLPPDTEEESKYVSSNSLRCRVWKILLRIRTLDADKYIELVKKGSAEQRLYDKIRNDTFRTFKTNEAYNRRVPEKTLIRLLNAFIHSCDNTTQLSYVQGMNVICAVFLYIMPELDAFYCFSQFAKFHSPLYFYPLIEGAFEGIKLVDEIMKVVDPELYIHLISKEHKADVYAMGPVLSFSACTPPLEELLKLWDLFIAFGVHMNIVCVVAQIVIIREELLVADRPNLRTLPPLDANLITSVAIQLVRQLPEDLYNRLVTHPYKGKKANKKYSTLPRNFKALSGKFDLSGLI